MNDPFGYCAEPECYDEPALPSMGEMAKGLLQSTGEVVQGILKNEGVFVSDDIQRERMRICSSCEFFRYSDNRCSKCGCFMQNKTKLKKVECPVHKWDAVHD
jgi:hypothetical protein